MDYHYKDETVVRPSYLYNGNLYPGETAYLYRYDPQIMKSHYNDVTMGTIASQITSLTIVYSTVYSDTDQRKHQSSASLAFVRIDVDYMDHYVYVPSQWETTLQCNVVSHWLGVYTKWSLRLGSDLWLNCRPGSMYNWCRSEGHCYSGRYLNQLNSLMLSDVYMRQ